MTATAAPPLVDYDRTPPHSTEAEQCVLGAMMMSKDVVGEIIDLLTGNDFYTPRHSTVFNAITDLYAAGDPVDAVTVAAHLISRDGSAFERLGGIGYLHTCVQTVPTAANGSYYARIVADKSTERRLINAGLKIVQLGYGQGGADLDTRVDQAQQSVYDVTARRDQSDFAPIADFLQPTLDEIESAADPNIKERGVPTGFTDLDRLLNNLQGGQVIVVAGRPGTGKSTLGVNIATHASVRRAIPAAIFSLEMSSAELTMRILSDLARVPLNVIRSGRLSDDDWTKVGRVLGPLSEAPLFIDESADLTPLVMAAKARRLVQQHGVRLIVVDYLQLMTAPSSGRESTRQVEVSVLSRAMKVLAKLFRIPVIVIAQLNRGPENRADKRPQLSDLRESGSVEQDADVVILIHRDDYYDKESPRAGEADLIVAKHRNGPTDTITVAAQLHLCRFVDMAIA